MSASALGEVVGVLLERVGPHPDLVVLLATRGHAGALEDLGATVRALLAPAVLIGVVATTVSASGEDVTGGPGLVLWAGLVGPVLAVAPGSPPQRPGFEATAALLLGDATGSPDLRGLPARTVGGCSDARGLLVQDRVTSGAAAVLMGPAAGLRVVEVEGIRPIGPTFAVTRAEREVVYELDGRPAHAQLLDVVADGMAAMELHLVGTALRLAPVGCPSVGVRGVDRANGALACSGPVREGARVRFALRDPASTATELDDALAAHGAPAVLSLSLPSHPVGAAIGDRRDAVAMAGCSATALRSGPFPAGGGTAAVAGLLGPGT